MQFTVPRIEYKLGSPFFDENFRRAKILVRLSFKGYPFFHFPEYIEQLGRRLFTEFYGLVLAVRFEILIHPLKAYCKFGHDYLLIRTQFMPILSTGFIPALSQSIPGTSKNVTLEAPL